TLEQQETGLERRLETDARGRYRALRLPPGPYRIHVEREGLQAQVREGVELSAGQVAQVDFRLALGEQREELVVRGEASLVSVDASDWGGLVEPEKLEDLPLNGRDLFELSALEPGATVPPSARSSLAQGLGL